MHSCSAHLSSVSISSAHRKLDRTRTLETKLVKFQLGITLRIGLDVSLRRSAGCSFTFVYRDASLEFVLRIPKSVAYECGRMVSQYQVSHFSSSSDIYMNLAPSVLGNGKKIRHETYENRRREIRVQTSFCKDRHIASLVVC